MAPLFGSRFFLALANTEGKPKRSSRNITDGSSRHPGTEPTAESRSWQTRRSAFDRLRDGLKKNVPHYIRGLALSLSQRPLICNREVNWLCYRADRPGNC